jgi:hypothetical protein
VYGAASGDAACCYWDVDAPGTGFEPVALRLTAACSTAELTRIMTQVYLP